MNNTERLQAKHYNKISSGYINHYDDKYSQKYKEYFIYNKIFSGLALENMDVLEAMCGSGQTTEYLLGRGAKVTGLDISGEQIQLFKNRWKNAPAVNESIIKTSFNGGSFDLVFVFGGLHHVHPKINEAIREIYRILKPGGYFCFVEPHKGSIWDFARKTWYPRDAKMFAANEGSIDIEQIKNNFQNNFSFEYENYSGNIAYLLVLNSLVFRIPLFLKSIYSYPLFLIEWIFNLFTGKKLSCYVIARWKKLS